MPKIAIKNEDIREMVKARIWEILDNCLGNPAIDIPAIILSIPELAVVDREAELPNPWDAKGNPYKFMRDEGWVKECL